MGRVWKQVPQACIPRLGGWINILRHQASLNCWHGTAKSNLPHVQMWSNRCFSKRWKPSKTSWASPSKNILQDLPERARYLHPRAENLPYLKFEVSHWKRRLCDRKRRWDFTTPLVRLLWRIFLRRTEFWETPPSVALGLQPLRWLSEESLLQGLLVTWSSLRKVTLSLSLRAVQSKMLCSFPNRKRSAAAFGNGPQKERSHQSECKQSP